MEQKIVITNNPIEVNELLCREWRIKSVTAQHVSSSKSYGKLKGDFCFVLEREL